MRLSRVRFALIGTTFLALSGACGGRSTIDFGLPTDGTNSTGGIDGGVTGGTGGSGATSGGSGGVAGTASGGTAGIVGCGPELDQCDLCTCLDCYGYWTACKDDGGCYDIVSCAKTNGCTGLQCYLGPCQQVINDNGGPFGNSATLAQQTGQCAGQYDCCGAGGSGGTGGGTGGSPGGGGTGGGVVSCVQCIAQQCPAIQQCLFDTTCRDGAICVFQQCLGGGTPDLGCMVGCFNGDFQAAFQAFQAFQCFFTNCGSQCNGVIPGLPGGGGGGIPGFGGTGG
jgi:hypothetical protein